MCHVYEHGKRNEVLLESRKKLEEMLEGVNSATREYVVGLYSDFLITKNRKEEIAYSKVVDHLRIDEDIRVSLRMLPEKTIDKFRFMKNLGTPSGCSEKCPNNNSNYDSSS